ncbi:hypothetical protein BVE84_09410 [Streptococcus azizii]|uniref:Uncharacterized protein n=1 Tax=Streptococcus azizii TaxID=1579424 RepID=A0AB36JMD8_9STRE|nr:MULTISPECIES: hypothetical protein [Streptococcus]MBF0776812.1 hypothetical protein [Streptococcus sp. 19428wD3_AN2]ONK25988.1 hypothetical protein BVE86_08585 [Streptococcus azizii]ONK26134.1 hypothetical protein BVE85_09135 [Streptococcus azizii]ONK26385.1 hypothetical protein BVE84_09410 [Streptococcus azizii]TFU82324.1 hypothetical protein E4T83_08655 [Streptococcus sp. AN2]
MVEFQKNVLLINHNIVNTFDFNIRTIIELKGSIIILLEIPFENTIDKNNILSVDYDGNIIWTLNNADYTKNIYPMEQINLIDDYLCATDFYGRRLKISVDTGKITEFSISK